LRIIWPNFVHFKQ